MLNILAIDTSTDACSVALRVGAAISHRHELIPRQHNQRLFSMLQELLPDGGVLESGIELFAYAHGPGSFTGLRIAASAVQGLSYATGLPVAGISTLACLAQGAWRRGVLTQEQHALVLLDARVNEVYWGLYSMEDGIAKPSRDDAVSAPAELPLDLLQEESEVLALGSGLVYLEQFPESIQSGLAAIIPDQWPDSVDLLALADVAAEKGELLPAESAQPVYLRNEIHWKKISEQG